MPSSSLIVYVTNTHSQASAILCTYIVFDYYFLVKNFNPQKL